MTLRVIGAGLGRTGTFSLKSALEKLGQGRCYHMADLYQTPEHVPLWLSAAAGEPVEYERLFEGYRSCVHWPGCSLYEKLMARFPDATVVLSLRDAEEWYDSVDETIYRLYRQNVSHPQPWRELHRQVIWDGVFEGRFDDRRHAIGVYEQHNARVRSTVPAERLVEFTLGDGWGPLCDALGLPEPDEPFPHLNDRSDFAEIAKRLG